MAGLSVIDKSHFTSTQNYWILQHLLIPRIQWPLLIYKILIVLVFKLEQNISVFIRKWLHLHHSTSSLCFYSVVSPYPLPIKCLSRALKPSKIRGDLLLRSSQDLLVPGCIPKLQTGTWKVGDAVSSCEYDIKINQVYGNTHHNRHGLGYTTTPKSLETNHQNITTDIFQTITNQLMAPIPSQVQDQWTR